MFRRRIFPVLCIVALLAGGLAQAQTKLVPQQVKPVNSKPPLNLKPLDINSASEEEFVAVGIEKATAKKIIDGRPFRNKTELVSRMLLSRDEYNKVKASIVAKQPPKAGK